MFQALILDKKEDKIIASMSQLDEKDLPDHEVLVNIEYSSLNYKDGGAIQGIIPTTKVYPTIPGIDLAGEVILSNSNSIQKGQKVLATGWGIGEKHWGGFAQKGRFKSDWLLPIPKGLSTKKAMIVGTAGLTAMLCILKLQKAGISPEKGQIVVSGASGGVGSFACCLLKALGYDICAITGETGKAFLQTIGVEHFITREQAAADAKPLEARKWAGGIDTTGGTILARMLSEIDNNGAVAACGLAAHAGLKTTVMPFILRGISLLGVDSVFASNDMRKEAWQAIADNMPESMYEAIGNEISLEQTLTYSKDIIAGNVKGRTLINMSL